MTRSEVTLPWFEILDQQLDLEVKTPAPERRLVEDLGATSLDNVSLQMACEERFNITISDAAWATVKTVEDGVGLLSNITEGLPVLIKSTGPYVMKNDTCEIPTFSDLYEIPTEKKK